MKSLCFIVTLVAVSLHCKGQEDEAFTTIFSEGKYIIAGKSENLVNTMKLKEFEEDITSMTVYKDYLFVSVKGSHWWSDDSAIWRANITNLKNFDVDPKIWDRFHVMNNRFDDITCMVAAIGYIYAGLSDGTVVRCSTEERNNCKTLWTLGYPHSFFLFFNKTGPITGIDYNPEDGKLYVLAEYSLYKCPMDNANSACKHIGLPRKASKITAFKVGFNAVWLGVAGYNMDEKSPCLNGDNIWLMKCSVDTNFCDYFEKHPQCGRSITSISVTNQSLYFGYEGANKIWRCDPKNNKSCFGAVFNLNTLKNLIIIP